MQQRLGLDVEVVDCPWGEGAHEGKLEEILKKDGNKKIKAVRACVRACWGRGRDCVAVAACGASADGCGAGLWPRVRCAAP